MKPDVRKIIHIDMDAFYASVEQRDRPELKGRSVAVGGAGNRGVVAAASYEARKYGVRSAMPSATALRLCPSLTFVKARFDVYKGISQQIRSIFREYTDLIEPLALDEAYLDVTANKKDMPYAMEIAEEIRKEILEQTQLTASAGISYNKFLAKTASDFNKPNGQYVITPLMAEQFIEELPIEKFFGVGKVTARRMHDRNIFSGADLKTKTMEQLSRWFGKAGAYYYNIARGVDHRKVNPDRITKSIGAERTYSVDLTTKDALQDKLIDIVDILEKRISNTEVYGKTLTLKVKYSDFKQITRGVTEEGGIDSGQILKQKSFELLNAIPDIEKGIRLLGLSVSNFKRDDDEVSDHFLGQLELDF